jgi:(1->4)-alpha-D-glucan 1-alpha-D-glucosylmutase
VLGQSLRARRDHAAAVGPEGRYLPLEVTGQQRDHVVAFARLAPDGDVLVVVTPRLPGSLMADGWPLGGAWDDTSVHLGEIEVGRDLLAGAAVKGRGTLVLRELLTELPLALLAR